MVTGTSASKHSRSAFISSFLGFLLMIYVISILVWRPAVPPLAAPSTSGQFNSEEEFWSFQRTQHPPADSSAPVKKLLRDLKEATRIAAQSGGLPYSYTAEEEQRWREENPCRARSELPPLFARKNVEKQVKRNYQWEAVFEEYSKLHRTCIRKIGNITDYFLTESTVPGCKFLTGESLFGLGNKITYSASVVLYGILTQRVVLFFEWSASVSAVMCEPFEGSSWKLPYALDHLNKRKLNPLNVNEQLVSNSTQRFLDSVDQVVTGNENGKSLDNHGIYFTQVDDGWHPVDRFFCDSEQDFLSDVRWISTAGCFYFMPKLFAITKFRPILEALFPDRMALTHILRSAFLPYNVAWDRILRNDDMFFGKADKRVSIQVRYRHGAYEHSQLHEAVNARIVQCLLENDILPNVSTAGSIYEATNSMYNPSESKRQITKVLITSLHTDFFDLAQDLYLRHPTLTGESVGFIQLTHDDDQQWGLEPDTQALVEIVLLSLADHILVTPLSTFGGVAQAYGGVKPWIVEHSQNGTGSCVRASSVDLCYQQATERFTCPHDLAVHTKNIFDEVPYIEKCLDIDSSQGLILITG